MVFERAKDPRSSLGRSEQTLERRQTSLALQLHTLLDLTHASDRQLRRAASFRQPSGARIGSPSIEMHPALVYIAVSLAASTAETWIGSLSEYRYATGPVNRGSSFRLAHFLESAGFRTP